MIHLDYFQHFSHSSSLFCPSIMVVSTISLTVDLPICLPIDEAGECSKPSAFSTSEIYSELSFSILYACLKYLSMPKSSNSLAFETVARIICFLVGFKTFFIIFMMRFRIAELYLGPSGTKSISRRISSRTIRLLLQR